MITAVSNQIQGIARGGNRQSEFSVIGACLLEKREPFTLVAITSCIAFRAIGDGLVGLTERVGHEGSLQPKQVTKLGDGMEGSMQMSDDKGEERGTMTGCLSSYFKKIGRCGAQRDRRRSRLSVCRRQSFVLRVAIVALGLLAMICVRLQASAAIPLGTRAQTTRPSPNGKAGAPAGNVANGKRIYLSQGCDTCHGVDGQGAAKETATPGPPIAATSKSLAAFISIVRSPFAPMPPFTAKDVSDTELAEVHAFLESVPPSQNSGSASASATASAPASFAAGNAQNGQALFTRDGCYECDGRQAEGAAATGPRLGPNPIPLAALIKYVRPPTCQMPPYTAKVVTDAELADIHAFLQSLPAPPPAGSIPLLK